jgi:hypothetical protein
MSPHRLQPTLSLAGVASRFFDLLIGAALRLFEMPIFVWVGTLIGSLMVALLQDPFTWALGMLVFASIVDYATGVATARAVPVGHVGAYDPLRAARGRREKIITGVLMIGCRMMEGLATEFGVLNIAGALRWLGMDTFASSPAIEQGGIITTVVTMLIAVQELSSVYDHRLANGGSRILVLEFVFSAISASQKFILGKAASKVAEWAGSDAGDEMLERWRGQEMMDDAAHRAKHGTPAPRRRAYDVAVLDAEREPNEPNPDPSDTKTNHPT